MDIGMKMLTALFSLKAAPYSARRAFAVIHGEEYKRTRLGWHIIVPGQLIRLAQWEGVYLAPQFLRHHLSNVADAWTAASMLNSGQAYVSARMGFKPKSRPIAAAALSLAIMGSYEAIIARGPNRSFDWVDMGLHTLSAVTYAAVATQGNRRRKKGQQVITFRTTAPK